MKKPQKPIRNHRNSSCGIYDASFPISERQSLKKFCRQKIEFT